MLGLKNRWLLSGLALTAFAGACGEDSEDPAPEYQYPEASTQEAGLQDASTGCVQGSTCVLPSGATGTTSCQGGTPTCVDLIGTILDSGVLNDSGLFSDGSFQIPIPEGGFQFPEAGFDLGDSGIAKPCPASFTCSDPGDILGSPIGVKVCGQPLDLVFAQPNVPPACSTASMPCTEMGLQGTCQDIPIPFVGGLKCMQLCQ